MIIHFYVVCFLVKTMCDNQTSGEKGTQVPTDELAKLVLPSQTPEIKEIKKVLSNLQQSMFGKQYDMELQKVRQENRRYPLRCEDCNKTMTKDEIGGQCIDRHTHEVLNRNGGYLCKKHYQRALQYGGKCDQCCWWEII